MRKLLFFAAGLSICFSNAVMAQAPDPQEGDSNNSWTATTDSNAGATNPTRTIQNHTQNGNRTVDVRSLQTRGPDGNFRPYQDIETETVQVSAETSRTTTRTFVRNDSGTKTLFQITQEEKQVLSDGVSKVVRTTSNPDANGRLQLVQREDQETRKTSPDVEETKTTFMLPTINGGLTPAMQVLEHHQRTGNTVAIKKTTLLPDGTGKWQVGEVRQSTVKDEGETHTTEERVSRPDPEGKLGEVTRTVARESQSASGDRRKSAETYSVDVPGAARDHSLHMVQRLTTTQRTDAGGQQTIEQSEQVNPGDPGAGPQLTTVTTDTARFSTTGDQATRTIQVRDGGGNLGVVSVDMTKSTGVQAIVVQIAPSKPK